LVLSSCRRAIAFITEKNMPIVLEEAFLNTMKFINDHARDARVIPPLGGLNGGYNPLSMPACGKKAMSIRIRPWLLLMKYSTTLKLMGMSAFCLDQIFPLAIQQMS